MADLVTIATVTREREVFLPAILACVLGQTHENFEWLILDDSAEPSRTLSAIDDPRISYIHVPGRHMSIGEKRNMLCERARGEVIVQFDDDDYYAPNYLSTLAGFIETSEADMVSLQGWFVYDMRHKAFGYRVATRKTGLHFIYGPRGMSAINYTQANNQIFELSHFGYGFSYAYRKAAWASVRFDEVSRHEDVTLARRLSETHRLAHIRDTGGLCLHIFHESNTGAQHAVHYVLPPFQLKQYFPTLTF